MAGRFPTVPPPSPPPGSPAAHALAADTLPPQSAAAPQTDSPPRCPTRNCPCATARPGAAPAPPHCSWARLPLREQKSTAPATTSGAAGTAPPPSDPGCPGHAAVAAPAELGAGSTVAAD